MWALTVAQPFQAPLVAGAGGYFAPLIRGYMRRSNAPDHIGMLVAVKDRQNALRNPYAHLRNPDITVDSVLASQMLWDPIRYDETCPSSDGACAYVLAGRKLVVIDLGAAGGPKAITSREMTIDATLLAASLHAKMIFAVGKERRPSGAFSLCLYPNVASRSSTCPSFSSRGDWPRSSRNSFAASSSSSAA